MLRRILHPKTASGGLYLSGGIFALVFAVLALIAGGLALSTMRFLDRSAVASGTVTGFAYKQDCHQNSDHGSVCTTTKAPQVRFTTADGQQIDYTSRTFTHPSPYVEGQQVEVRYLPEDPTNARIDTFSDLWLAPVIVGGIGGIFGILAAILVLIGRGVRPRPPLPPSTRRPWWEERKQASSSPPSEPEDREPEPGGWQDPGTLR